MVVAGHKSQPKNGQPPKAPPQKNPTNTCLSRRKAMGPRWLFWPVWPFCHQLLRWKKWRTLHAPTILQGNQPHSTPKPKTMGAKPEETVEFLERMGSNPWNTPKTGALPPALCSWGEKKTMAFWFSFLATSRRGKVCQFAVLPFFSTQTSCQLAPN